MSFAEVPNTSTVHDNKRVAKSYELARHEFDNASTQNFHRVVQTRQLDPFQSVNIEHKDESYNRQ